MKITEIKISDINVGTRFREDLGDVEALAESIKEKGLLQPITVDHEYTLLAGGRRLSACQSLGMETIHAVVRQSAGELDNREIELLENVQRKDFHWSERANLERQIFEIKQKSDYKWSQREQAELLEQSKSTTSRRLQLAEAFEIIPELAECKTEDEAWKSWKRLEEDVVLSAMAEKVETKLREDIDTEKSDPITHILKKASSAFVVGDALKKITKVADGIATFAEVDPPYGVELDKRRDRNKELKMMDRYNEIERSEYQPFLETIASEVYRVLGDNAFCVWWYGPDWHTEVRTILESVGFTVSSIPAIWVKGQAGQTASPDTMLGSCYEPFYICRKGMPKLRKPGRANVFQYTPVPPNKKIHPTERPIEMMQELLRTFAYPGGRVLVPFLGSGVTIRACYKENMVGWGYDKDEIIKRRFLGRVQEDWDDSFKPDPDEDDDE